MCKNKIVSSLIKKAILEDRDHRSAFWSQQILT